MHRLRVRTPFTSFNLLSYMKTFVRGCDMGGGGQLHGVSFMQDSCLWVCPVDLLLPGANTKALPSIPEYNHKYSKRRRVVSPERVS